MKNNPYEEKERSRIRETLRKEPYDKFISDWMDLITTIYGIDTLKASIEETEQSFALTGNNFAKGIAVKANYRTYTKHAIILFEEVLKYDDERRAKK